MQVESVGLKSDSSAIRQRERYRLVGYVDGKRERRAVRKRTREGIRLVWFRNGMPYDRSVEQVRVHVTQAREAVDQCAARNRRIVLRPRPFVDP